MSNAPHYEDLADRLAFGLPDRLGKALKVGNVSSGDMAAYLEVAPNTISNYINGRTPPKKAVVLQWAVKTGVPPKWLETGRFPEETNPTSPGTPEQFREWLFASGSDNVTHVDFTHRPLERAS